MSVCHLLSRTRRKNTAVAIYCRSLNAASAKKGILKCHKRMCGEYTSSVDLFLNDTIIDNKIIQFFDREFAEVRYENTFKLKISYCIEIQTSSIV